MRKANSTIITNSEFAYYKKLCDGETEDIRREGLQAIIRQVCAEGRLLLNGQVDYIKRHLPIWITSESSKVRMWSLWLATLVNDNDIESICMQSMTGETDPQFIAPALAILSARHGKQEYEKTVRKMENRDFHVELNETILNMSSALFSCEPFYKMDDKTMKSILSKTELIRWSAIWIPVYYAYPFLTKKRNLYDVVSKELVCELFKVNSFRINEYAMWCLCLHGNTKEKDLPVRIYDYKALDPSIMKWYFQIILTDESVVRNAEYIQELLSNAINYTVDVKEGLLRGLESIEYHREFVESIVSWYLGESSSQIKRLLLTRMIQHVETDMQFEETYYEILVDEYSRGGQESEFIKDYIKMWERTSPLVILDDKLLPTFGRRIKQIGGIYMENSNRQYEKIADNISIEGLQINNSSGNTQTNYYNYVNNIGELESELISGLSALESMEETSAALLQEIRSTKMLIQSGIKKQNRAKLLGFLSTLADISAIATATPVFISTSNKVVGLISALVATLK